MIDFLWTLLFYKTFVFLLVLTVLVFVHEMGHYLVAKWAGVKIVAFSIGFGPEIFGWYDKSGTRWKFCWIPLGGYVKMFGDLNAASAVDPEAERMSEADKAVAFPYKPLYKRAAVVAAGPIANFILAFLIFAAVYVVNGQSFTPPIIGYVEEGSAAAQADLEPNDEIKRVNGRELTRFEDLTFYEQLTIGESLSFEVLRSGRAFTTSIMPERKTEIGENCREITFNSFGFTPPITTEISNVSAGSAAAEAGLKSGDIISKINGKSVFYFQELRNEVRELSNETVNFSYLRDGVESTTSAKLGSRQVCNPSGEKISIGLLGVTPSLSREVRQLGIGEAVSQSLADMWSFTVGTIRSIGQMLSGKRGTEDLGGPIGIANMVGGVAQVSILQLVMLTAILSLNLGLINLFPIPVLDGGHLVLYAYEAVMGRPLGPKGQEFAFKIGFMLIIGLMLFLLWNDILRAVGN